MNIYIIVWRFKKEAVIVTIIQNIGGGEIRIADERR